MEEESSFIWIANPPQKATSKKPLQTGNKQRQVKTIAMNQQQQQQEKDNN